jgi:hypothetical protein
MSTIAPGTLASWAGFLADTAIAVGAIVSLFEGTRRYAVGGLHRGAIVMIVSGALLCGLYGAFHFWRHRALTAIARPLAVRSGELPAGWGANLKPELRESSRQLFMRLAFIQSGVLQSYVAQNGERRWFTPTQQDLAERDARVRLAADLEREIRDSYARAFVWWLSGIIAALLGYAASRDRTGAPHGAAGETPRRKSAS